MLDRIEMDVVDMRSIIGFIANDMFPESTLWQRRFWEHVIRDEADYRAHVDYIHFNPVKHGYLKRVIDWPYSSFHRYVKEGVYEPDWGVAYDDNHNVGEPVSCPLVGKRVGTKSVPTLG